jgi:hypothetical protein
MMSRPIGHLIADSLAAGLGYAERLKAGLEWQTFARFATPGGQVVESNHPSFVYGHLSLYPVRIVTELGGEGSSIVPSDHFQKVYSASVQCEDDVDGTIYPPMDAVLAAFFDNYRLATEQLRATEDSVFNQPNPLDRMKDRFPTIGSMHNFYCGGHLMIHLGQLSAWRRMMGLPPA